VWASGIVESFDIFEHRFMQLSVCVEGTPIVLFLLQVLKKALAYRIVEGVTLFGKGLDDIKRVQ